MATAKEAVAAFAAGLRLARRFLGRRHHQAIVGAQPQASHDQLHPLHRVAFHVGKPGYPELAATVLLGNGR